MTKIKLLPGISQKKHEDDLKPVTSRGDIAVGELSETTKDLALQTPPDKVSKGLQKNHRNLQMKYQTFPEKRQ